MLAAVDRALFALLRAVPALRDGGASRHRRIDRSRARDAARARRRRAGAGRSTRATARRRARSRRRDSSCAPGNSAGGHFIAFDWRGGRFAGCGLGRGQRGHPHRALRRPGRLPRLGPRRRRARGPRRRAGSGRPDPQERPARHPRRRGPDVPLRRQGRHGSSCSARRRAAPLINAVGRPRAVINGTCLDYLAESFMAGDPLQDGGFVVVNGIAFDDDGRIHELETPYPGGNLFSLASGRRDLPARSAGRGRREPAQRRPLRRG